MRRPQFIKDEIFLLVLLSLLTTSANLRASPEKVWQIGIFNESSSEFNSGSDPVTGRPSIDYTNPASDPVFVVGRSDPARHWFAFQPGSSNGRAGYRPHPFTIQFGLVEKLGGLYTLKVALLAYSARLPRLQVEINGHRGWFYQKPELNYAAGDTPNVFIPYYATATITLDIPSRFLNQGTNKLLLTAIDEPGDRDDSQGSVTLGTSGIIYDALELDHDPGGRYSSSQITAEVIPTVFYRSKAGRLVELIDVWVRLGQRPQRGEVTLRLGEGTFTRPLEADREFGEQQLEFEVPEFTSAAPAEVRVSLNGRTQRFPQEVLPAKKWNVFVVPHEHLDVGYSDYQAKVAEIQSRVIDEAIEMIRNHPDFRFTLDGYWCVQQFLAGRSEEERHQFLRLVQENKIFVPAQFASNVTGFPTAENLIRSLYPSYRLYKKYGGSFDHAIITDVPSYSWSYASVMAAAGLKYFVAASDNWRAPILLLGRLHQKSPFWWEGPDGGRILMWYSRHYHHMAALFGLPPQVSAGHDALPRFLQIYTHPEYRSDGVLLFGTQVENTDLFPQQAALVDEWNKVYAYPRLRYAGFADAVEYVARQFGGSIPVMRGDGGPYWEDGIASDARVTALARENEHRALAAEKFSTISSLVNPLVRPDRVALDGLWENTISFDEHTWEADRSGRDPESQETVRQRAVKEAFVTEGKRLLEHVLLRSMAAIADFIQNPSSTLVVFNPVNWPRSSLVEVDLDRGLELLDLVTKQTVPYEVLSTGEGYRHIRFLASEVPPVGYKCYALRAVPSEPPVAPASTEVNLESPFYRLVLDPASGAVRNIFDKQLNRELVDAASPFRFNQYVYVAGADERPNRLLVYSTVTPIPKLTIHGAGNGSLISVSKFAFGTVARLRSSAPNTPRVETEIVLFDGQKKIEFINHVHKTKVYTKEGVYFAFPFALDSPQFLYETQNGFVDPAKDLLPGAGREWFSVQHWVALREEQVAAALVPIDAHLVTLGDIVRGTWPETFSKRKGWVFSYVMNNYWDTNWPAGQGGDVTFRYVLTSAQSLEPGALSRLGWEETSPLEVDEIKNQDKAVVVPRPLDSGQSSFLQVDKPNVVLVTWKRAEDDKGTILRFLEVAGEPSTVRVTSPLLKFDAAWMCNAVEENQHPISASPQGFGFDIKPFQILTVRVQGTPALR
jgi:alpha-mannosidase